MRTRRRTLGMVCLSLGFFFVQLALLLSAFHGVGTDGEGYYRLQMQANILPEAGISEADLIRLDAALAAYLAGDKGALYEQDELESSHPTAIRATVFGEDQPAFNEKELTHMADCFELFVLLRTTCVCAIILGAILLGLGLWLRRGKGLVGSFLIGLGLLFLPAVLLGAWAALDFTSAFNFFHRMLFTNDLWLLDPRTDLLIRICPESMFAGLGLRIVRDWLMNELGLMLIVLIAWGVIRRRSEGTRDERI